jgi:hypothetical protein
VGGRRDAGGWRRLAAGGGRRRPACRVARWQPGGAPEAASRKVRAGGALGNGGESPRPRLPRTSLGSDASVTSMLHGRPSVQQPPPRQPPPRQPPAPSQMARSNAGAAAPLEARSTAGAAALGAPPLLPPLLLALSLGAGAGYAQTLWARTATGGGGVRWHGAEHRLGGRAAAAAQGSCIPGWQLRRGRPRAGPGQLARSPCPWETRGRQRVPRSTARGLRGRGVGGGAPRCPGDSRGEVEAERGG